MNDGELKRFYKHLNTIDPSRCWEWQGTKVEGAWPYGKMKVGSIPTGDRRTARTHRLSYEHFVGPLKEGEIVCHKCDNPPCCNPNHLFAGTQQMNMDDMVSKGRYKLPPQNSKGETNGNSALTADDVAVIKALLDKFNNKELGYMFGVTHSNISLIRRGKSWQHI